MKSKGCCGLGFVPLIKMISGYVCKLFAIGDIVAMGVDELIEFPVGPSSVQQFARFT
jgi:hypothetical protein